MYFDLPLRLFLRVGKVGESGVPLFGAGNYDNVENGKIQFFFSTLGFGL